MQGRAVVEDSTELLGVTSEFEYDDLTVITSIMESERLCYKGRSYCSLKDCICNFRNGKTT